MIIYQNKNKNGMYLCLKSNNNYHVEQLKIISRRNYQNNKTQLTGEKNYSRNTKPLYLKHYIFFKNYVCIEGT